MIATRNSLILASSFNLGSGFFALVTSFLAGSSSAEAVDDASKAAVPAVRVSSKSESAGASVFGGMASSAIDLK